MGGFSVISGIVYGAGFYPALDRLKMVWRHIPEANLKLKPTKCCLMRAQVPFLGHIVSRQGIGVDPAKTEAVEKCPTPVNVKDMRAFLGLASYYRRYIPGFSTVAAPMNNLARQGVDLVWNEACEGDFRTLKAVLALCPLAYPTREGHFTLSTDASDVGIGAVLEQDQDEGGQIIKRVIAYASKTLSDTERRYWTTNKELLAVVMALELFRYYLTGRNFTVLTDHASLTWLRNFREPEEMVARWIARLQPFDFAIVHRPINITVTLTGYQDEHLGRARERPVPNASHFERKLCQRPKWPAVTPPHFHINVILMDMSRCRKKMLPCF